MPNWPITSGASPDAARVPDLPTVDRNRSRSARDMPSPLSRKMIRPGSASSAPAGGANPNTIMTEPSARFGAAGQGDSAAHQAGGDA